MKTLLIVDDEYGVRVSLQKIFETEYSVFTAANGESALAVAEQESPDLAVIDLMMPGMTGLELLPRLKQMDPQLILIVLSAMNDIPSVVEAVQLGAVRYLTKPFDIHEVRLVVKMALHEAEKQVELSTLESEITRWYDVEQVIGQSDSWRETLSLVQRAAASAETTVLFTGESGTGKELLARLTHDLSNRKNGPMIPIHCAAIPETLLESELFGHEKGSFTGASERRRGCVELADGGTLFLDEIGEMPLSMQSKLLRFLQNHQFMRIGGRSIRQADVRIVAATNRNLRQGVQEGWFREDLFYRLNVIPIHIPTLRERKDDVECLVRHFLAILAAECGAKMHDVCNQAMERLQAYSWPGNVRELRNLIERIVVLHGDDKVMQVCHLPVEVLGDKTSPVTAPGEKPLSLPVSLQDTVSSLEIRLITLALQEADNNLSQAAVLLQTTRRILKYKMDQYNLNG